MSNLSVIAQCEANRLEPPEDSPQGFQFDLEDEGFLSDLAEKLVDIAEFTGPDQDHKLAYAAAKVLHKAAQLSAACTRFSVEASRAEVANHRF